MFACDARVSCYWSSASRGAAAPRRLSALASILRSVPRHASLSLAASRSRSRGPRRSQWRVANLLSATHTWNGASTGRSATVGAPPFSGRIEKRGVLAVDGARGGVVRSDGCAHRRPRDFRPRARARPRSRRSPRNQRPVRYNSFTTPTSVELRRRRTVPNRPRGVRALELDRVKRSRSRGTRRPRHARPFCSSRTSIDDISENSSRAACRRWQLVRVHGGAWRRPRARFASRRDGCSRTRDDAEPRGFIDDDDVIVDADEHARACDVGSGRLWESEGALSRVCASSRARRPELGAGRRATRRGGGSARERRGGDESASSGRHRRRSPRRSSPSRPRDARDADATLAEQRVGDARSTERPPFDPRRYDGERPTPSAGAGPPRAKKGRGATGGVPKARGPSSRTPRSPIIRAGSAWRRFRTTSATPARPQTRGTTTRFETRRPRARARAAGAPTASAPRRDHIASEPFPPHARAPASAERRRGHDASMPAARQTRRAIEARVRELTITSGPYITRAR